MRIKRLMTGLVLGLGLIVALLALLDQRGAADDGDTDLGASAIRCVNPGGTAGCYASIQAAVNAAVNGDTIRVAQGTYLEAVVVAKSVILEGGWNASFTARDWNVYVTQIDAQRAGSVINVQGAISPTIEGFVLTGGDASSHLGWGGGILAQGEWDGEGTIVIRHNVITDNIACHETGCQGYGGGIMVYSSRAVIEYNTVISNAARTGGSGSGQGGGITLWGYPMEATLTGNTIISNTAVFSTVGTYATGEGGGFWAEGACDLVARDNEVRDNVAAAKGNGYGGGIYTCGEWYANHILSNTASISGTSYGGGVYAYHVPEFNDNVVQGNVASKTGDGSGGGIYALYLRDASGNTIAGNVATRGGGVYFQEYTGHQTFHGNHVTGNQATGLNTTTPDGGGGIASQADWVEMSGNDVSANIALAGGGVLVTGGSRYLVQDNQIQDNLAYAGGGLYVQMATGTIVHNQVVGNGAMWWGGGMYLYTQASPVLDRNVVMGNMAGGTGGAAGLAGGGLMLNVGAGTRVTVTNHIIAHNTVLTATAGGVHCLSGSCALIHCTIADNKRGTVPGEGVRIGAADDTNRLWNSIIVGHQTGVVIGGGAPAVLGYNDYWSNTTPVSGMGEGTSPYHVDPQFVDPAADDYHLVAGSLLIDAGDGSQSVPVDLDGNPRLDPPDVGADEHVCALHLPLVLREWDGSVEH